MSAPAAKNWFFLRGLIRESGHWDGFLERAQAALPGHKVIALELPGAGPYFREKSPTTISEIAEAVRRQFLEHRADENYLFAYSLGAMVALEWMHRHPLDLRGAILANTSLRSLSPFHQRLRAENYGRMLKMVTADASYRERCILEMTSERRENFDRLEKDWVEIRKARPVSTANSLRQLWAAARFYPAEEKPTPKILLLSGARDKLVSPLCSEAIARHWRFPLHTHPEAGHDLSLDQPEWVLEQIVNFN